MRSLLEYASQSKVAEALGVTRTAVWRWAHGQAVTPGAVQRVQALLRPDLQIYEEAPPPAWAEGLATRVADSVVERLATQLGTPDVLVEQFAAYLEGSGLLPAEEPLEESEGPPGGRGTTLPRVRSRRAKA